MTPSELAAQLGVPNSTLSQYLDELKSLRRSPKMIRICSAR
jgi:DNA-binding IclR family transcriptional regulator